MRFTGNRILAYSPSAVERSRTTLRPKSARTVLVAADDLNGGSSGKGCFKSPFDVEVVEHGPLSALGRTRIDRHGTY